MIFLNSPILLRLVSKILRRRFIYFKISLPMGSLPYFLVSTECAKDQQTLCASCGGNWLSPSLTWALDMFSLHLLSICSLPGLIVSSWACGAWYLMKDSGGLLCTFWITFLVSIPFLWYSVPQIAAASAYSNSDLCLLNSARLLYFAWTVSLCTVVLEMLSGRMPSPLQGSSNLHLVS